MNFFLPTNENTYVAIITFNPDNRLSESINVIERIFSNIVIVDNNSSLDVRSMINNNIHFIKNNENLGIAEALNIGAEYAISNKALWLLTLDQDTIPRADILSIFDSIYTDYPNKEKIGQIGVSFCYEGSSNKLYHNVLTLITSGSLLSLDAYKAVSGFRNDFFIDSVDFEYSLRLRKNGFVNLKSSEVAINHRLGDSQKKRYFFINFTSTNHPPQRRYYMARNHVIISFEYFLHFPIWVAKKNFFFIKSIFEILLIDDQKILKLKNTILGVKDGFKYLFHQDVTLRKVMSNRNTAL